MLNKNNKNYCFIILHSIIFVVLFEFHINTLYADEGHERGIKVDTMANELEGPHYIIEAEYGSQNDVNLFHSF